MTTAGLVVRLLIAAAIIAGIAGYTGLARSRRLARHQQPPDGFILTPEAFTDPTTGRMQRVWYNAATGERRYETVKAGDSNSLRDAARDR